MKIYICADIEGISGFSNREDALPSSPAYSLLAKQMSREVRAACEGFLQAGASSILVEDCHGEGRNILPSYLPASTKLISGITHDIFGVTGKFTSDFDALAFVGYHDASYSDGNPSAHTMSGRTIRRLTVNDELFSEFHIHTFAAATLGVPVIYLSGDEEICKKAHTLLPGLTTFATLSGFGNASIHTSPEENLQRIRETAFESLKNMHSLGKLKLSPFFHVKLEYIDHFQAKKISHYPGAKRTDVFVVEFLSDDYREIMRFFLFAL